MTQVKLEADGKTVIINISIRNEEVYRFLEEFEEEKRVERLKSALRIGIIGLKRMGVRENVDYVEKEFNTLLSKFEKMFDPSVETSHLGKLTALFREYFDKNGKLENLFDPLNGDTPISKLRKEITSEIRALRDEIIKRDAKQEVVNSTTLKGYEFEDLCEKILGGIVSNNIGDELERKTTETGELIGCMSGDFVISLKDSPDKKIVFETKDVETISQPMILENLEKSMNNRGAAYAVFVVKYRESLPRKIGFFNEYRGNMLVVALGSKKDDTFSPEMILHLAYQWAKMRLNTEMTIEEKAVEQLDEGIKKISEKLQVFSQIQRQCCNIDKSSNEIRKYSDELKAEIEEQVKKIQMAIFSVSEGS